ncbi:MAG: hypothetical protein P1U44_10875 [Vicingaceae bacterium]|nr:hypothetical protein [Vicingaceae bacterium]
MMCIIVFSCGNIKTAKYLEKINIQNNEKGIDYYTTNLDELKKNTKGSRVFYIGTDSFFHYFECYYDRTYKASASFKIQIQEYKPKKIILFNKENTYKEGYIIKL